MLQIFFKLLPFFALIGCGYLAVRSGFLSTQANDHITKFVFYFALPAMLFEFSSRLPIQDIFDPAAALAYLCASLGVYLLVMTVARFRGNTVAEASIEAQCSVIGNAGFLAIPILINLFGERAATPVLLALSVDLIFFGSLIVAVITGSREGRVSPLLLFTVLSGMFRNPMLMGIFTGLAWSVLDLPVPGPMHEFVSVLGAAATPCALFVIGGSLVAKSTERLSVALWLSFAKLVLHPLAVAVSMLVVFSVDPFTAGVVIGVAAMPVAGNIYLLASHYRVAPQRASTAIFISTLISILTLTVALTMISKLTTG